MPNNRKTW